VFAFFLFVTSLAQWSIVIYSAISACSLIVFGKRLEVGRYDWRLLSGSFGIPLIGAIAAISLHMLGPSGAW